MIEAERALAGECSTSDGTKGSEPLTKIEEPKMKDERLSGSLECGR
jgi:hypothetical protein